MTTFKNKNLILYSITIVFFIVFYYFLPFAGDDWAWGSSVGMERLSNAFNGYNGRYIGNLLIILITRSVIAKLFVCSLTMFFLVFILSKIFDGMSEKKSSTNYIIAFSSVLLLVLPNQIAFGELQPFQIFGSTVGWLSGFTNYVVPSVLILAFYYFVTNREYDNNITYVFLFFDGIIACLCVEHYTLFCLVFCFSVLAYRFYFYRKICKKSLFFFVGSFIGALVMFTNSSYRLMQKGNVRDNQRAVGFLGSLKQYAGFIFPEKANKVLVFGFEALIVIGIVAFAIYFLRKTYRAVKVRDVRNLLPIISLVVMTLPLLVTNSGKEIYIVAPRCYFLQYFMLVIFFFGKFSNKVDNKKVKQGIKALFAALLVITCIVYARLDYYGIVRDNAVNSAINNGSSIVEVIEYPKNIEHIQWSSNFIKKDTYLKRYQKYKNIPKDREIKVIER